MTSKIQREPEAARGAGGAGFASRVTREELGTGAVLLVLENAATPTVSVRGSLRAGSYFEPRDRPGLARLTAEMLKRGTRRRGKLELAGALEQVGASVEFDADVFAVQISARALSEDFPALASTLAEMLREPSFPAEELEKLKQQTVAAIQEQLSDTRWRAYERLSQMVFDEEDPFFVHCGARLVESIGSVTVEELRGGARQPRARRVNTLFASGTPGARRRRSDLRHRVALPRANARGGALVHRRLCEPRKRGARVGVGDESPARVRPRRHTPRRTRRREVFGHGRVQGLALDER